MAEHDQLPPENVGQQEVGKAASAQMQKSKDPFDQIHQNYTATDFKVHGPSRDLEMADNPSNKQIQRGLDDKESIDVDELANAPLVDLSSTSHIMDAILSNLQGLTPEQEEVRK